MKNSVLIVLAVIFLVILGLKWGHDARVKRSVAEADCYSQMANAIKDLRMSNKNTLLYLCSELWGEAHWRAARETDILARKEYICQRHMSAKDKLIASKNPEKLPKIKYEAYAKCMGLDTKKPALKKEVAEPEK